MTATYKQVQQIRAEAMARVMNKNLPFDVRMRSRETVQLCDERLAAEGVK